MQLINRKTQIPIVEFQKRKTIFHNRFLESEMRTLGILIPHGLRGVFNGKDYVYFGEEDFQRAFREVYYLTSMNTDLFRWID